MKKRFVFSIIILSMIIGLIGCQAKKEKMVMDEDITRINIADNDNKEKLENDENKNTDIIDENESSVDDDILQDNSDIKTVYYEADGGFVTIEYDIRNMELVETDNTYSDSMYFRCLSDLDNKYENYIDIKYENDYSAEDFINGLALQSGSDDVELSEFEFGMQSLLTKKCAYKASDTFKMTFYVIEHNDGAYVIEIGKHIYSEEQMDIETSVDDIYASFLNSLIFEL